MEEDDEDQGEEGGEQMVHPRATPEDIQRFLKNGASLRWLCPQRFSRPVCFCQIATIPAVLFSFPGSPSVPAFDPVHLCDFAD